MRDPSGSRGPRITFKGCVPRKDIPEAPSWASLRKQSHRLPVELRASECPFTALTNCSGNPRSFGACAALGEGWGPGGCPPGITRPTAVPTAGAGAWQCAWKLGSHDERLGRASAKSLKSSTGTSCCRPLQLPWQGWSTGREHTVSPCSGTAGPTPLLAVLDFCGQTQFLPPFE